eukprot:gene15796-17388_t
MIIPSLSRNIGSVLAKLKSCRQTAGRCVCSFSTSANRQARSSGIHKLLLLVPITTFGLGTWQVYRYKWKKGLIAELEARTSAEPVQMTTDLETLKTMEYRRVKVAGEFDHSKEILLGPRTYQQSRRGAADGGYHVITPFILQSTGERILVNRGWVGKKELEASERQVGQIEGPIEITAIVRKKEERPAFMVRNEPEKKRWHYLDIDSMAAHSNTLPILVDCDLASSVPGGPIGGQTRIVLRNAHVEYIITWYALSAATLYLYYQLRRRPATMFSQGPNGSSMAVSAYQKNVMELHENIKEFCQWTLCEYKIAFISTQTFHSSVEVAVRSPRNKNRGERCCRCCRRCSCETKPTFMGLRFGEKISKLPEGRCRRRHI